MWLNDERRIVELNISQVLLQHTDYDDRELISLVKSLKPFKTGQLLGICIIEVLSPGGVKENDVKFHKAEAKRNSRTNETRSI